MVKVSELRLRVLLKCLALFLLTVLLWHVYRFVAEVWRVPYLEWGTPLGFVFYLGFYILIFAMLVIFVKVIDRSSLYEIGLRKAAKWRAHLILGILFGLLAGFLELLPFLLAGATPVLRPYPSPPIIGFMIVDTLIVGLAEEGVFRGYIQRHLTNNHGFILALLISSVLFKAYHLNFFTATLSDLASLLLVLPSFGMFAGYFYYKAGENLLGPIVLHMFYDLFGTIVPIELEMGNLPVTLISILRIIEWFMLMLTVRILADKKVLA